MVINPWYVVLELVEDNGHMIVMIRIDHFNKVVQLVPLQESNA